MKLYHVTDQVAASAILNGGFLGGWGDDGFGVYLFSSLSAAADYAARGGWDGGIADRDAVILELHSSEEDDARIFPIDVHPEWPNPEFYLGVLRYEMDPDQEETWSPSMQIRDTGPSPSPP